MDPLASYTQAEMLYRTHGLSRFIPFAYPSALSQNQRMSPLANVFALYRLRNLKDNDLGGIYVTLIRYEARS
jgi:hypothetical protein